MSCFLPSPSVPSCPCGGGSVMPPCTEWPARLTPPMDCMIRAWSSIVDAKESVHWATQIEKLIYKIGYNMCRRQGRVFTSVCDSLRIRNTHVSFSTKKNSLAAMYFCVNLVSKFSLSWLFYARSKVPKRVTMVAKKCINRLPFLTLICQNWRSIVSRANPRANLSFFWWFDDW